MNDLNVLFGLSPDEFFNQTKARRQLLSKQFNDTNFLFKIRKYVIEHSAHNLRNTSKEIHLALTILNYTRQDEFCIIDVLSQIISLHEFFKFMINRIKKFVVLTSVKANVFNDFWFIHMVGQYETTTNMLKSSSKKKSNASLVVNSLFVDFVKTFDYIFEYNIITKMIFGNENNKNKTNETYSQVRRAITRFIELKGNSDFDFINSLKSTIRQLTEDIVSRRKILKSLKLQYENILAEKTSQDGKEVSDVSATAVER